MNPHKHMEAIFGAVAVTALLIAALPDSAARAAARTAPSTATPSATPSDITGAIPNPAAASSNTAEQAVIHGAGVMPVVVIKGKRLSAREKRRLALARA